MSNAPKDPKGIFLAALDIPDPAGRAMFVEKACDGDAVLRKRVENLLGAYGEPDGPLENMAAALAPTKLGESIREQVGSTIGPYKLMEQIGEGGFGLVFVAEQQQPIRRKVALKIIKPGMDTRDVIARFEAERQALALMDHPNIARVLDAGTTESGRPYFVMELVRGIPITDYCDQNQLTTRERLELFVPVCNAIQHAHLKGIIHRDVKPSNVLIMLHDDRPVVKVIDFGVAKALYQPLTEHTIYTRFAQMIGTPLYMSPEQAKVSGLDIDTRSDIYSLGVLLYELLTGTTPFSKERLAKAAYDELLKIIREEEPPKPSVRLSQSTATLPSIAAQRKTEPAKLSKMFHGDLDWIAMKALEKDRTRRYETANAFAADVSRYLNDEPVEASPPSASYRLRKFARKHRKPVIAMASSMAVLVFGIAGTTWGLFRAKQAEQATDKALGQMTNERDAKETALIAEAAERNRAERQLAIGLLRPIGFSDKPTDPGELHSFVDWSAIKESRLKLRVLETAFDNPETALRIARRADLVIQACVGLSPARRAQAIRLVSDKQHDLTADPRIRVAACWLALELGSADLPAWEESCNYLSDPMGKSTERFCEFVTFAAGLSDPQQVSQLALDPLVTILETPAKEGLWLNLGSALNQLAPRFDSAQVEREMNALIAILKKAPDDTRHFLLLFAVGEALSALARRLEPEHAGATFDALRATLKEGTGPTDGNGTAVRSGLAELAPRLDPAKAQSSAAALVAHLTKSVDDETVQPIVFLAPRMEPALAQVAWNRLIAIFDKSKDQTLDISNIRLSAQQGLVALALRLNEVQIKEVAGAMVAILKKSTDSNDLRKAFRGMIALAPRLSPNDVKRVAGRVIEILEKAPNIEGVPEGAIDALIALAPRLERVQAKRAADDLIAIQARLPHGDDRDDAARCLFLLAPQLDPPSIDRALTVLISNLNERKRSDVREPSWVEDGFDALTPRLESAQAMRAWDALIGACEKPFGESAIDVWAIGLGAMAQRLTSAQVVRTAEVLLEMLEKSNARRAAFAGLIALAPRLEPAQADRAWDALVIVPQQHADRDVVDSPAWSGLVALAPRLSHASADNRSTTGTAILLDYCSSYSPYWDAGEAVWVRSRMAKSIDVAKSISSRRSLAMLLSHPACVSDQRAYLLRRFEELVLYDGKPVLSKPASPDAKRPSHDQTPPRRFHNLHDAAAWIQQNWPDFDLETNCSATWRSSR
jgi:serine/threonine protein kinase